MIWSGDNPAHIAQAAQLLAEGRLLAFPTETVYGLGADADRDEAVMAIYEAKGRPTDHPLIVHIADPQDAAHFADPIPDFAWKLLRVHSPGPLTLILPRRAGVAQASAAGQGSIGLRCPSHPVAQALLRAARDLGVHGVSGPSANRFGRVSPTRSEHVVSEFGPELDVLDGGACEVGIESTIIDCTRGQPVLLRPGMLDVAALSRTAGMTIMTPEQARSALGKVAPKASGTLASHYAPNAQVKLRSVEEMEQAAMALTPEQRAQVVAWSARQPQTAGLAWRAMPEDPTMCAQVLFQTLRDFERMGVREIWVSPVPSGAAWDGVRDRLTRASH